MTNKQTATWDDFCTWLVEDMELGKLPIEWCIIKQGGLDPLVGDSIVRIDLFPDKPYKVSVGIANKDHLINRELAYYVAYRLMFVLKDAIESNSPRCFIPYTQF